MESFAWLTALALLAAPAAQNNPSPAEQSVPPTQRAADRPAHESPYSAFGAPHARRKPQKRTRARLRCADGTVQTQGPKAAANACDSHGGVKQ